MAISKRISVTEFKNRCLQLLEEVRQTGESIQILKRGKPLATVVPSQPEAEYRPGRFKAEVQIVGDILVDSADLGVEWEALK